MERSLAKIQDELVEYREKEDEMQHQFLEEKSDLKTRILSLEKKIQQYELENIQLEEVNFQLNEIVHKHENYKTITEKSVQEAEYWKNQA